MTREEAKDFGLSLLQGIAERNNGEYADNVRLAIEALSQPSLPSNLDEAAHQEAVKVLNNPAFLPTTPFSEMLKMLQDLYKAGAELMAGQFQKIEGKLVDWYETNGVDYCHGISTNESFEVPEGFYIKKK